MQKKPYFYGKKRDFYTLWKDTPSCYISINMVFTFIFFLLEL